MKPEDQIKALASLDGIKEPTWYCGTCREIVRPENVTFDERHYQNTGGCGQHVHCDYKPYLTSYDAIIPILQKQPEKVKLIFGEYMADKLGYTKDYYEGWSTLAVDSFARTLCATPSQLCESLLRATGKWTE